MPRRPTRTVPTVLLHGRGGRDPDGWQSWLAGELTQAGREVRFPELPGSPEPTLDDWLAALRATLSGLPDDGFDVVGHSLGAVLWLHHAVAPGASPRPARVGLVSLPHPTKLPPEASSFGPIPLDLDAIRKAADGTVLVGGDDDPVCPGGVARVYGAPLKMAATMIAGGGHLTPETGYGPWPAVLDWCGRDNLAFIA
jgi:predicted alpha/beta hydrolase family esterase